MWIYAWAIESSRFRRVVRRALRPFRRARISPYEIRHIWEIANQFGYDFHFFHLIFMRSYVAACKYICFRRVLPPIATKMPVQYSHQNALIYDLATSTRHVTRIYTYDEYGHPTKLIKSNIFNPNTSLRFSLLVCCIHWRFCHNIAKFIVPSTRTMQISAAVKMQDQRYFSAVGVERFVARAAVPGRSPEAHPLGIDSPTPSSSNGPPPAWHYTSWGGEGAGGIAFHIDTTNGFGLIKSQPFVRATIKLLQIFG